MPPPPRTAVPGSRGLATAASVRPAERGRSCQLTVLAMEADTARGKQELVKVGMMLISTIREQKKRLRAVYK